MDNNNNTIYQNQQPQPSWKDKLSVKTILINAVLLIIGVGIGYLISSSLSEPQQLSTSGVNQEIPPVENEDPRLLLDPIEILKTPVFTEWGGSVEGTVVDKTNESFTIKRSGRQVEIYLQQSLTGFYEEVDTSQTPEQITFEQLSVGDYVRGAVTISRETLDNNPDHHIFANVFTVIPDEDSNSQ